MTQSARRPSRGPRGRVLLLCALLAAGLVAAAPGPASMAATGTPPALLATFGGPGHAAMYPSGLEYSSFDDTLVVADTGNHTLSKYNPVTGALIWSVGGYGTAGGNLNDPRDVGVDSLGNIYVADTGNVRIAKFDAAGTYLTSWKGPTGDLVASPIGVTVSTVGGSDRVYIADSQDLVMRVRAWTAFAEAAGDTTTFKSPWGVSVGPDGSIWVADTGRNRIVKMSATGVLSYAADGPSLGLGPIDGPFGVAFGPAGQIYVSLVWDNRILHLEE